METVTQRLQATIAMINEEQANLEQRLGLPTEAVDWMVRNSEHNQGPNKVFIDRYLSNRSIRSKLISAIQESIASDIPFENPN